MFQLRLRICTFLSNCLFLPFFLEHFSRFYIYLQSRLAPFSFLLLFLARGLSGPEDMEHFWTCNPLLDRCSLEGTFSIFPKVTLFFPQISPVYQLSTWCQTFAPPLLFLTRRVLSGSVRGPFLWITVFEGDQSQLDFRHSIPRAQARLPPPCNRPPKLFDFWPLSLRVLFQGFPPFPDPFFPPKATVLSQGLAVLFPSPLQ